MKKYLRSIKEIYDPEISDYLIEDGLTLEIVFNDIYNDCSEYLHFLKGAPNMLYRGMQRIDDGFGVMYPIEDRTPIDTPKYISDMFDDILYDKFGWHPRSEGVFTYQKKISAGHYGDVYMIFPVDGFEYVWSPNIIDFYMVFEKKNKLMFKYLKKYDDLDKENLIKYFDEKIIEENRYSNKNTLPYNHDEEISKDEWLEIMTEENIEKKLKYISNEYIDKDFNNYLKNDEAREIMIKCDKYYYVSIHYYDDFMKFLEKEKEK